jgi:alpha-ketoglutarate-dependent taurine dioxygenase
MFSLRPLHEHFAAEIRGVDITKPLRPSQFAELRDAWNRHAVLLIRGQAISESHQIAFAAQFGTLERFPPAANGRPGGPQLLRVSNVRADGSFVSPSDPGNKYLALTRAWHKDATYKRVPSFATVLRGLRVPTVGGETELVDLRIAFERLRRKEQERLAELKALHSYGHAARSSGIESNGSLDHIDATHPLVAWHDDGRRSLFLSPLHMERIEGMDEDNCAALLAELVQLSTSPALIYRHAWQDNDILLWDNRTTMHRGLPYADQIEQRTLHRTVINGEEYAEGLFARRARA